MLRRTLRIALILACTAGPLLASNPSHAQDAAELSQARAKFQQASFAAGLLNAGTLAASEQVSGLTGTADEIHIDRFVRDFQQGYSEKMRLLRWGPYPSKDVFCWGAKVRKLSDNPPCV